MADVGRDSVNAKNAFNSFVCQVFANLRQKLLFFCGLPKLQKKAVFFGIVRICKYMGLLFLIFFNAKLFKNIAHIKLGLA